MHKRIENTDGTSDLEMAAVMYASMHSRLYCITRLARKSGSIFPDVTSNFVKLGLAVPNVQVLVLMLFNF